MFCHRALLLALICVSGCSQGASGENIRDATGERENAAPAGSRGSAVTPYKAGQALKVLKDRASCRETGPNAGEPWEMKAGSFVKFLGVEGSELRVDTGIECLIAPDAVGPA